MPAMSEGSSKRLRSLDSDEDVHPSKRLQALNHGPRFSREGLSRSGAGGTSYKADPDDSDDSLMDKTKTSIEDALDRASRKELVALFSEMCRNHRRFLTSMLRDACQGNSIMEDWVIDKLTHLVEASPIPDHKALLVEDEDDAFTNETAQDLLARFRNAPVPKRVSRERNQPSLGTGESGSEPLKLPCASYHLKYDPWPEGKTGECRFHPGSFIWTNSLDKGSEKWAEVLPDAFPYGSRYPKKFIWTCCRRDANGEPCQKGFHAPDPPSTHKTADANGGSGSDDTGLEHANLPGPGSTSQSMPAARDRHVSVRQNTQYRSARTNSSAHEEHGFDKQADTADEEDRSASTYSEDGFAGTITTYQRRSSRRSHAGKGHEPLSLLQRPNRNEDEAYLDVPDLTPATVTIPMGADNVMEHVAKAQMESLDLSEDPLRSMLSPSELSLASSIRFTCGKYLFYKRRLFLFLAQRHSEGKYTSAHRVANDVCQGMSRQRATILTKAFEAGGYLERKFYDNHLRFSYRKYLDTMPAKDMGEENEDGGAGTASRIAKSTANYTATDETEELDFINVLSSHSIPISGVDHSQTCQSLPESVPNFNPSGSQRSQSNQRPSSPRAASGQPGRTTQQINGVKAKSHPQRIWTQDTMNAILSGSSSASTTPHTSLASPAAAPTHHSTVAGMAPAPPLNGTPFNLQPNPATSNPFKEPHDSSFPSMGALAQTIFASVPKTPAAQTAVKRMTIHTPDVPSPASSKIRNVATPAEPKMFYGKQYPAYASGDEARHAAARRAIDLADPVFTPQTGCRRCKSKGISCYYFYKKAKCAYCISVNGSKAVCSDRWAFYPGYGKDQEAPEMGGSQVESSPEMVRGAV